MPVIAADRRQARTIMRYIVGFLEAVPMLRATVVNRTRESVELSNDVVIEVHTASFRAVRGYTVIAAVCGTGFEGSFCRCWRDGIIPPW